MGNILRDKVVHLRIISRNATGDILRDKLVHLGTARLRRVPPGISPSHSLIGGAFDRPECTPTA